jgi:succinyl-CoA synthetase alpha subunit
MDLLEYQGKQPFKKHGVPVPDGRHAATVPEAVEAAEELGFPVMIKAQVQIGGRGNAGGIKAARFHRGQRVSKPVLAYIAGFTALPGKTMGPAGTIVSGSRGTAAAKPEALERSGVRVGRNPTEVSEIAVEILGERV